MRSPHFVINDLVTGVWENRLRVQGPAVCSKVLDLLKIRSPWAGLPTNLELRSADDAALAPTLTPGEGMVAVLSTLDMAAPSMFPQRSAEASKPGNAIFYDSAFPVSGIADDSHRRGVVPPPPHSAHPYTHTTAGFASSTGFEVALLENCSFLAHLVLRQVRAESDLCRGLLEPDSSRKKLSVVPVSPTPPKANVLLRPQPEEPTLPPEIPSSLPTLWVEIGCRQMRTVVCEKERS